MRISELSISTALIQLHKKLFDRRDWCAGIRKVCGGSNPAEIISSGCEVLYVSSDV